MVLLTIVLAAFAGVGAAGADAIAAGARAVDAADAGVVAATAVAMAGLGPDSDAGADARVEGAEAVKAGTDTATGPLDAAAEAAVATLNSDAGSMRTWLVVVSVVRPTATLPGSSAPCGMTATWLNAENCW